MAPNGNSLGEDPNKPKQQQQQPAGRAYYGEKPAQPVSTFGGGGASPAPPAQAAAPATNRSADSSGGGRQGAAWGSPQTPAPSAAQPQSPAGSSVEPPVPASPVYNANTGQGGTPAGQGTKWYDHPTGDGQPTAAFNSLMHGPNQAPAPPLASPVTPTSGITDPAARANAEAFNAQQPPMGIPRGQPGVRGPLPTGTWGQSGGQPGVTGSQAGGSGRWYDGPSNPNAPAMIAKSMADLSPSYAANGIQSNPTTPGPNDDKFSPDWMGRLTDASYSDKSDPRSGDTDPRAQTAGPAMERAPQSAGTGAPASSWQPGRNQQQSKRQGRRYYGEPRRPQPQ